MKIGKQKIANFPTVKILSLSGAKNNSAKKSLQCSQIQENVFFHCLYTSEHFFKETVAVLVIRDVFN